MLDQGLDVSFFPLCREILMDETRHAHGIVAGNRMRGDNGWAKAAVPDHALGACIAESIIRGTTCLPGHKTAACVLHGETNRGLASP